VTPDPAGVTRDPTGVTCDPKGAPVSIQAKYDELLAAGWTPVVPVPVVPLPVPGTAGHFFSYVMITGVGVTIYEHPDLGVHEVHGAILERYLSLGGPAAYGFPISDELDEVIGDQVLGRVSHFERGSIFYADGHVVELPVSTPSGTEFEIYDGIDISYAQGTVDWAAVAHAGLGFAYMKATEGDDLTDHTFAQNWAGSRGVLPRGAYHFFHARTTPDAARAQADHFVDTVAAAGGGAELPPMVDVEAPLHGATVAQAETSLQFFLSIVEQATGQRPLIYTFPFYWTKTMGGSAAFAGTYKLWIASYAKKYPNGVATTRPNGPALPLGWTDYAIWQHAIKGGIPGINGLVDRDMVMAPAGMGVADYLR
jgi:GH25 family lysozyme M1 (1,4-beta-N-acetylmuramidase)